MPMLRVNGVVKEYALRSGVFGNSHGILRAVDDVSFEIAEGSTFGLVGESGCGKSTLSRMVLGMDRPTSGSVEAAGRDPTKLDRAALKAWRRDVQIIAQDPAGALPVRMRAARVIEEPWRIHRMTPPGGRAAKALELLRRVGLDERHANAFPHQLSGGQRQRVLIARAVALQPRLVVCDEPVSALDVSVQAQVLDLLRELQREQGLTYLFISHDLGVVRAVASEIGVMFAGRIVERGPAEALYANPAHPYTRELLDAMPTIRAAGRPRRPAPVRPATLSSEDRASGCRYRMRCPLAVERCATERPAERVVGPGRLAACHRAEDMLARIPSSPNSIPSSETRI
jgi:oligopeptide/dipeptide ABC transporter ATP-binding protein